MIVLICREKIVSGHNGRDATNDQTCSKVLLAGFEIMKVMNE